MRSGRDGASGGSRASGRAPGTVRVWLVDAWIWGAVVLAIVLVIAGGIAWWLARGCMLTRIGATGAIFGGVLSLIALVVLLDSEAGLRVAAVITIGSGVWLLAWALAGGIRGQRAAPRRRASGCRGRRSRAHPVAGR